MTLIRHVCISVIVLVSCTLPAIADEEWVGKDVIPKRGTPEISRTDESGRVIVLGKIDLYPVPVREEKGDWVKVQVRDIGGWIPKDNVVRMNEGIEYFTSRINSGDDLAEAYACRAWLWAAKKEHDIAIKDANEAIRIRPTGFCYGTRGQAWHKKREYEKAILDYTEAIRLDAKTAWAFFNRGLVYEDKCEPDKAIQDYSEAIRLDPKHVQAYLQRGNAWRYKKEYDNAIRDYNEALRLDPKELAAYQHRGYMHLVNKEYDKSIRDFDQALVLNPKDAWTFVTRGEAFAKMKAYERAIQDYDEAIHLDAKDGNPWDSKAYLFATCEDDKYRDVAKAEEYMSRALTLRPSSPWNEQTLGAIAAARGRFDEAIKHQQKALEDKAYKNYEGEKAQARLKAYAEKKPWRE